MRGVSFHQVRTAVMMATLFTCQYKLWRTTSRKRQQCSMGGTHTMPRLKVTQSAIFSALLRFNFQVTTQGNRAKMKSMTML